LLANLRDGTLGHQHKGTNAARLHNVTALRADHHHHASVHAEVFYWMPSPAETRSIPIQPLQYLWGGGENQVRTPEWSGMGKKLHPQLAYPGRDGAYPDGAGWLCLGVGNMVLIGVVIYAR
jgi:hypothetical protein